MTSTATSLLVRRATPEDAATLRDLAALDGAAPLGPDVLLAELDDAAVAAVDLATGRVVADPFTPTVAVCDVLRVRAAQLGGVARPGLRRGRRVAARLRPAVP